MAQRAAAFPSTSACCRVVPFKSCRISVRPHAVRRLGVQCSAQQQQRHQRHQQQPAAPTSQLLAGVGPAVWLVASAAHAEEEAAFQIQGGVVTNVLFSLVVAFLTVLTGGVSCPPSRRCRPLQAARCACAGDFILSCLPASWAAPGRSDSRALEHQNGVLRRRLKPPLDAPCSHPSQVAYLSLKTFLDERQEKKDREDAGKPSLFASK
jgi:hypothetical protein